jgi:superfamily II DNA/RNA helicase
MYLFYYFLFFILRKIFMTFTELQLQPKILQAISACGYNKPTPIQLKAIPIILSGKDIVASAQTGTGKTAAYVFPCLQLLSTKKSCGKPRVLILAPTRELSGQITKVINKYGKFLKVTCASFVGGVSYGQQLKELSRPLDIIIATPGRLMDHMENKRLDLSQIEMLIIDEADRMLDMGFINAIKRIVKATPRSRQTLLFSATADSRLMSIMKDLLKNPVRISVSEDKVDPKLINQKIYMTKDVQHKKQLLKQLLDGENIFKAIIFSATKRNAAKLALQLSDNGYAASPMHGDLKQNARNRTLAKFREGKIQFLVATDVAARGIDVTDISHVINYDLPRFHEDYVHRIGRTGRAGKTGIAISLALHSEMKQLQGIERYIGKKLLRAN